MPFKLSNLNSNLALTLGYLNPAFNNSIGPGHSWIQDFTPCIPDSRYWIQAFVNGTWFWIPVVGGIPDSLTCIADSKTQDS